MSGIQEVFDEISNANFKSVGDRMKAYENDRRKHLVPNVPVIIRVDGRGFSSYTSKFKKPFDELIIKAMQHTAIKLCEDVQNVKVAYSQSDEITLVIVDPNDQMWYKGNLQKIVSIAAGIATYHFNDYMDRHHWFPHRADEKRPAMFDARAFQVPQHEVNNVLVWRQRDGIRNSISMYAQRHFSQSKLNNKGSAEQLGMLLEKGIDWNKEDLVKQRGFCVVKEFYILDVDKDSVPDEVQAPNNVRRSRWNVDDEVPIFSKDPGFVDVLVNVPDIDDKIFNKR